MKLLAIPVLLAAALSAAPAQVALEVAGNGVAGRLG